MIRGVMSIEGGDLFVFLFLKWRVGEHVCRI